MCSHDPQLTSEGSGFVINKKKTKNTLFNPRRDIAFLPVCRIYGRRSVGDAGTRPSPLFSLTVYEMSPHCSVQKKIAGISVTDHSPLKSPSSSNINKPSHDMKLRSPPGGKSLDNLIGSSQLTT